MWHATCGGVRLRFPPFRLLARAHSAVVQVRGVAGGQQRWVWAAEGLADDKLEVARSRVEPESHLLVDIHAILGGYAAVGLALWCDRDVIESCLDVNR